MSAPRILDIVVPMAGKGSRFVAAGFKNPKPLIDVAGLPMIARVIENLRPSVAHRFIFLVLEEHLRGFDLTEKLQKWAGPSTICVPVDKVTEGAACTVLLAKKHLRADHDLVIANSDQIVDVSFDEYVRWSRAQNVDGSIMTFEANDPKWSFAKLDPDGYVIEVAEKIPISNLATVGIYYFLRGTDFVTAAEGMINKNIRVNNEFYVCPVYNEMIARRQRILTWTMDARSMHGVGTPEDLTRYLEIIG